MTSSRPCSPAQDTTGAQHGSLEGWLKAQMTQMVVLSTGHTLECLSPMVKRVLGVLSGSLHLVERTARQVGDQGLLPANHQVTVQAPILGE